MHPSESSGAGKTTAAWRQPIGPYLRLLWNLAPPLLHLPASGPEGDASAPFLSSHGLHLPDAPADTTRAAAAHAAAHLVFSPRIFVRHGVAPITQALIGVLEDARVEALAWRQLPGLRRLWAPLHTAEPADGDDFETLLLRLSRALVDPTYDDPHPWVRKGRVRFGVAGVDALDAAALRAMASALGHDLGQMRMAFDPRRYRPGPDYRDDNRWLWADTPDTVEGAAPPPSAAAAAARVSDGLAPPVQPETVQWRYPEWDERIARLRPEWCTVTERHPPSQSTGPAPDAGDVQASAAVLRRALRTQRVQARREREGDTLDLDAALRAAVDRRSGWAGEARVYRRSAGGSSSGALFVLVDCSASSAMRHELPGGPTRLALQQQAAAHLAVAAQAAGWRVAVQGFCSDGRHGVVQWRILDFAEPWSGAAASRLGALRSDRSTRLGTALRHATRALADEAVDRKWVLVMTDGEPHDVDIHDPRYLPADARHAVRAAERGGMHCACLLLAAQGDGAARQMFGAGRHAGLRDVEALPTVLARLLGH